MRNLRAMNHMGETESDNKPLLPAAVHKRAMFTAVTFMGFLIVLMSQSVSLKHCMNARALSTTGCRIDRRAYKESQYDLLADEVRKNIDMELVYKILNEGI